MREAYYTNYIRDNLIIKDMIIQDENNALVRYL